MSQANCAAIVRLPGKGTGAGLKNSLRPERGSDNPLRCRSRGGMSRNLGKTVLARHDSPQVTVAGRLRRRESTGGFLDRDRESTIQITSCEMAWFALAFPTPIQELEKGEAGDVAGLHGRFSCTRLHREQEEQAYADHRQGSASSLHLRVGSHGSIVRVEWRSGGKHPQ